MRGELTLARTPGTRLAFLLQTAAVMDFEQAPESFGYIVFDRTDREADERRFHRRCAPVKVYMIAWQATLVDDASLHDVAVVRTFGRKGRRKRDGPPGRAATTPYPSLQAAWPLIRAAVKTRLRHRNGPACQGRAAASSNPAEPAADNELGVTPLTKSKITDIMILKKFDI